MKIKDLNKKGKCQSENIKPGDAVFNIWIIK